MQSHWRINVAVNGRHLFATAPESLTDMTDAGREKAHDLAQAIADGLRGQYPDDAVTVTVTCWTAYGLDAGRF